MSKSSANLLCWAVVVLLAGGLLYGLLGRSSANRELERLPDLTLETYAGKPKNLREFVGKPVVLNTWATWCGPCRREMPLLLEQAAKQQDIQFVFVNMGEGPEAIRIFLEEVKLEEIPNSLLDKQTQLTDTLKVQGLPTTLFFDAEGNLVDRHIGEIDGGELAGYLGRLE